MRLPYNHNNTQSAAGRWVGVSMYRDICIPFEFVRVFIVTVLVLMLAVNTPYVALADDHYISLSKIFPNGKCSPMAPNFELMTASFKGGEMTQHKIHDDKGELVETITTFINKERDQWAMVGSKRDEKVIFCLYASGIGQDSVNRRTLGSE